MFYQLLRPFSYLTINHPAKKVVDWRVPGLLTLVAMCVLVVGRGAINVWGADGLVSILQGLVQGLPGFYIAALAAVATFGRQTTLDSLIPEPTPTIETWYGEGKIEIGLTRRRFLCLLFAHLTAVSVCISVFASFGRAVAGPVQRSVGSYALDVAFYVGSTVYVFFVFQMIVVTLWGLYYLSDKMHQPDADPLEPVVDEEQL